MAALTTEDLVHLRRARDLIDREYARPLDVPAMARAAHASPSHFTRQYKQAFGESPHQHLLTRRVERAMALLRVGELSVTEVCFAVGFQSLGSFSARFREIVGMAPSAYRQALDETPSVPACMARAMNRPARHPVGDRNPTSSDPGGGATSSAAR